MSAIALVPFRWRTMWYAEVHKAEGDDTGRFVDAIIDIQTAERLLSFIGEYRHSVVITLYRQDPKRHGTRKQRITKICTYYVDSKFLDMHEDVDLTKLFDK